MKDGECKCVRDLPEKQRREAGLADCAAKISGPEHAGSDDADIVIERCVVFRDQDWGSGAFCDDDVYAVFDSEGIFLMCGHRIVEITEDIVLQPDEARSVAKMLLAAADEMEAQS